MALQAAEAPESNSGANSKSPTVQRKHFNFTMNNYDELMIVYLQNFLSSKCDRWIFQEEIAPTTGTPHLQGYFRLKGKAYVKDICSAVSGWHITALTNRKNDKGYLLPIEYCRKSLTKKPDGRSWSKNVPEEIRVHPPRDGWSMNIEDMVCQEPDERKIYWYVDKKGGKGKSALCKYLAVKYGALVMCGKAADMKYGIMCMMNNGLTPRIVLIDLPRTFDQEYLCYTGIEEIKNGLFYSTKYESGQCIFNSPHVIIFSNDYPKRNKLSADRWIVIDIT